MSNFERRLRDAKEDGEKRLAIKRGKSDRFESSQVSRGRQKELKREEYIAEMDSWVTPILVEVSKVRSPQIEDHESAISRSGYRDDKGYTFNGVRFNHNWHVAGYDLFLLNGALMGRRFALAYNNAGKNAVMQFSLSRDSLVNAFVLAESRGGPPIHPVFPPMKEGG